MHRIRPVHLETRASLQRFAFGVSGLDHSSLSPGSSHRIGHFVSSAISRESLRKQVFDRYGVWICDHGWMSLLDLADRHPDDQEVRSLIALTSGSYRLYYLREDAERERQ